MPIQSGEDLDFGRVLQKSYRGSAEALGVTQENTLVKHKFDAIGMVETSPTVETYNYYVGGLAGDIVTTVVVTYSTSAKTTLVSVEKTFEADLG